MGKKKNKKNRTNREPGPRTNSLPPATNAPDPPVTNSNKHGLSLDGKRRPEERLEVPFLSQGQGRSSVAGQEATLPGPLPLKEEEEKKRRPSETSETSETSDRANSTTPTYEHGKNLTTALELGPSPEENGPLSCPDSGHASPYESDDSEAWQTVGGRHHRSAKWNTGFKMTSGFRSAQDSKNRDAHPHPPGYTDSRSSQFAQVRGTTSAQAVDSSTETSRCPKVPCPTSVTEAPNTWAARAKAGAVTRKAAYDFLPNFASTKDKESLPTRIPDKIANKSPPEIETKESSKVSDKNVDGALGPEPSLKLYPVKEVEPSPILVGDEPKASPMNEIICSSDDTLPTMSGPSHSKSSPDSKEDPSMVSPLKTPEPATRSEKPEYLAKTPIKCNRNEEISTDECTHGSPVEGVEAYENQACIVAPDLVLKHPLNHCWTFWSNSLHDSSDWSSNLVSHFEFDTIEDFWSAYHYIILPAVIPQSGRKIDYSIFIKGINPTWEDPLNKAGGRWLANYTTHQIVTPLLESLLFLIGETNFNLSAMIHGCVLSLRPKNARVGLWINSALKSDQPMIEEVGRSFKQILKPKTRLKFEAHDSVPKCSAAVVRVD